MAGNNFQVLFTVFFVFFAFFPSYVDIFVVPENLRKNGKQNRGCIGTVKVITRNLTKVSLNRKSNNN